MGYLSNADMSEYHSAVLVLVAALEKEGVDLNLSTKTDIEQRQLIDEISKQTYKVLIGHRNCCGNTVRFFKDFCVAEIVPEDIEWNAKTIAAKVKHALSPKAIIVDDSAVSIEMKNVERNSSPTERRETKAELQQKASSLQIDEKDEEKIALLHKKLISMRKKSEKFGKQIQTVSDKVDTLWGKVHKVLQSSASSSSLLSTPTS